MRRWVTEYKYKYTLLILINKYLKGAFFPSGICWSGNQSKALKIQAFLRQILVPGGKRNNVFDCVLGW